VSSYKKYFNNPYKFRLYTNSSSDLYNYQMNNLMDGFYDSAMNRSTDGSFKAVCLSGIKTEDNNAGSQNAEDAQPQGNYMVVTVKPLTSFGNILPDPASYSTPEEINSVISLYQSMFSARSDYVSNGENMPQFGQIVTCYFEDGSISDSNFSGLRFQEPKALEVSQQYLNLATIEGVQTATGAFLDGSSGLLGTPPSYEELGADHLGAAESGFADSKFGPGPDGVLRKKAWEALRPFLTKKTVLTSVYRGQDDQNRIIKNYATRYGFQGDTSDYDAMHAFIRSKPTPGLIVARNVGRGHGGVGRTGAFDLSGDNLDLIWQSVEAANAGLSGKVKFAKLKQGSGRSSIIERGNNCVHVHFELSDIKL